MLVEGGDFAHVAINRGKGVLLCCRRAGEKESGLVDGLVVGERSLALFFCWPRVEGQGGDDK